jgi:hypothetical protein
MWHQDPFWNSCSCRLVSLAALHIDPALRAIPFEHILAFLLRFHRQPYLLEPY